MRIAILIPTLVDHYQLIVELLRSLSVAKKQVDIDIYIWINNVTNQADGNKIKKALRRQFSISAQNIVFTSRNCGYTGSLNKLIDLVCFSKFYDWYFVMNDDITLDPDFFRRFQKEAVGYNGWSPGVRDLSGKPESYGLIYQKSGLAFPVSYPPSAKSKRLLCGTCLALSSEAVKTLTDRCGYIFNPLYFAYAEDVELSLRLNKLNLPYRISGRPLVTHLGSRTLVRGSYQQLFLGFRNLIITTLIHWKLNDFIFRLPWIMAGLGYFVVLSAYKGYFTLPFKVFGSVIRRLPLVFIHRKKILCGI